MAACMDFSKHKLNTVPSPYKKRDFIFTNFADLNFSYFKGIEAGLPKGEKIGGIVPSGDPLIIGLPSETRRRVVIDYVSGIGADIRIRAFNSDGKYIGYFFKYGKPKHVIRRTSLELPTIKYLYIEQCIETLFVTFCVDRFHSRKPDPKVPFPIEPKIPNFKRLCVIGP